MTRIIGFDPGVTTGVAVIDVEYNTIVVKYLNEIADWRVVPNILSRFAPDKCIIERYVAMRINVPMAPAEMIGIIKYICYGLSIPIVLHPPAKREFVLRRYKEKLDRFASHSKSALTHAIAHAVESLNLWNFELLMEIDSDSAQFVKM